MIDVRRIAGLSMQDAIVFLRYTAASGASLALDMGMFLLLLASGWSAATASAAGYAAGILLHWLASSRLVFPGGARTVGASRIRQKALFVLSALAGLCITVTIVWSADVAGADPRLAKLAAVAVAFMVTFFLRKTIVFAVH